ncbi:MAG TPA: hypothetical protein VG841_15830 [Caulobacterales bacterium]|nr:hypothetical protein [Caulobacterales bacterium]
MRAVLVAIGAALALSGCQAPPHDFPASAKAQFNRTCPANDSVCECTWDQITRAITYEQYEAALTRFRREGLMDPHITHARTYCLEHHHA